MNRKHPLNKSQKTLFFASYELFKLPHRVTMALIHFVNKEKPVVEVEALHEAPFDRSYDKREAKSNAET